LGKLLAKQTLYENEQRHKRSAGNPGWVFRVFQEAKKAPGKGVTPGQGKRRNMKLYQSALI
jgi:hypothetical protein